MWYDEDWKFRLPITVENDGAGGGSDDVTISIPFDLDHFWDNVKTNGEDVRIVAADGQNLQTYDLASFNSTTRSGTIEVQTVTMQTSACAQLLWLYYGNSGAADATTTFTPSAALSGYLWQARPPEELRVRPRREAPGATAPANEISKTTLDQIWVWFLLTGALIERTEPHEGSLIYEEVDYVANANLVFNGGSDATSTYATATGTRFTTDDEGFWVGILLKAGGATADVVVVRPSITTAFALAYTGTARVINPRCLVKIDDPDDQ